MQKKKKRIKLQYEVSEDKRQTRGNWGKEWQNQKKKKQKWKNKAGREVGMDRKLRRLARYQGENLKAQRCV